MDMPTSIQEWRLRLTMVQLGLENYGVDYEDPLTEYDSTEGLNTWSLFSGVGGMDVGFKQAGYNIKFANEVDPNQAKTHAMNFPGTMLSTDSIHLLSTDELVAKLGLPDVIVGGFPCVTYSKYAALHGTRHSDAKPKRDYTKYAKEGGDLFLHYRRFVADTQPKAFVVENVTDLLGCSIIMEAMKNTPCPIRGGRLGRYYTFTYGKLNTKDFGIAQKRERMFLVGINKDAGKPALRKKPLTMTHTVGKILEENPDVAPLNGDEVPNYIQNRINGKYRDKPSVKEIGRDVIGNTCLAHYASDQSTTMVKREDGTLTPYSVREYARLQGFPDDFKFENEKHSYRGIGNAVSVPVARAVAEAIRPLIVA